MSEERLTDEYELSRPCPLCGNGPRSTGNCDHLITLTHGRVAMSRSTWEGLVTDRLAVRDLCARHGITVEGIVALVDALFDYQGPTVPGYGWLRRLARGEEA